MKHRVWLSIAALAVLAGCGRSTSSLQANPNPGAPVGSDQAQVSGVLQNNPEYVDEDVWQSSQAQAYDNPGGFAAIRPLRFWREIASVDRTVDTQFGAPDSSGRPTMALVTIHRHVLGTFNVVAGAIDPTDTSRSLIRKRLDDDWTRKLVLMRMPAPRVTAGDTSRPRWRVVGTSGVNVQTRGGSTHIVSLRIQSGTLDTTITDPLALHRLRSVVLVQPGEPVTLTATTGDSSDVVLFYGHDMRRRFANAGHGTFQFEFPAGSFPGLRHFGVDALSNGTLFDDQAPYDSNAWVFAYTVDPRREPVEGN